MSQAYDRYLSTHKLNVMTSYYWIKDNLPDIIAECPDTVDLDDQLRNHDASKTRRDEYHAYDAFFYSDDKSQKVKEEFNQAWLSHIHRNPHHWQYWILVHDDTQEDTILEMPYKYIIEMICDWLSFSWNEGNLTEIFDWYEKRKDHIRLAPNTRETVEDILKQVREKLDEIDKEGMDKNG